MAICRIYLITYQRHSMLKRALNSLLMQTVKDWICELHNDDPEDYSVQKIVDDISDPRICIVNHKRNLGPISNFNLIYNKISEPFASMLEDDNWWQPNFLETMIKTMRTFHEVSVAWSNMCFWKEENNGKWTNTKRNAWNNPETDQPKLFYWPEVHQILGALHSQGAMMVRSEYVINYVTPEKIDSGVVEAIRERAFRFPILFIPKILANFAITKETSRPKKDVGFQQAQMLLAGSFLAHIPLKKETTRKIWRTAYCKQAKNTSILFFASLFCPNSREMLKYATVKDWVYFILSCIRHPIVSFKIARSTYLKNELWDFLYKKTYLRLKEAQKHGFKNL